MDPWQLSDEDERSLEELRDEIVWDEDGLPAIPQEMYEDDDDSDYMDRLYSRLYSR